MVIKRAFSKNQTQPTIKHIVWHAVDTIQPDQRFSYAHSLMSKYENTISIYVASSTQVLNCLGKTGDRFSKARTSTWTASRTLASCSSTTLFDAPHHRRFAQGWIYFSKLYEVRDIKMGVLSQYHLATTTLFFLCMSISVGFQLYSRSRASSALTF